MAANRFAVDGDQDREIDVRMCEIKRQLRQKGGSPLDPAMVLAGLQMIMEGLLVVVLTLAQRIARGRFYWVNSDINEKNFPRVLCDSEYTLETVHPGKDMSTDEVLEYIEDLGPEFESADVHDLADYGADHPEEQRQYPIAELGSGWMRQDGFRFVAALDGSGDERGLRLVYCDDGWLDGYRFLVRRKKSA